MSENLQKAPASAGLRTLAYLFISSLVVRIICFTQKDSLWLDESLTGWRTQSFSSIFEYEKPVPPLFPILVWMSRQVLGDGTWGLRFPSIVFGAALAPTLYYFLLNRLGHRKALAVALVGVFNTYSVSYSIESRCYALASWLALVHVGLLWRICCAEEPPRKSDLVYFALTGTALAYTHNWGLLMMAGGFTSAFCACILDRGVRQRLLGSLWKPYAAIAAAYLLYVPTLLGATSETGDMGPMWPRIPVGAMIHAILSGVLSNGLSEISAMCVGGALIGLSFGLHWRDDRAFWGRTMLFTLAFAALLQWRLPIYLAKRYDVVFLGGFLIVLGFALDGIVDRYAKRFAWGVVSTATLYGLFHFTTAPVVSNTKGYADLIESSRPDLTLVAAHRRFDPLLSVSLAYEFQVLRGIAPRVLETPKFTPLEYGYVYIPPLYQESAALQAIPPQVLQQRVAEATAPHSRVAFLGVPEEVAQLRGGLMGQWKVLNETYFLSTHESVVYFLLMERVPGAP